VAGKNTVEIILSARDKASQAVNKALGTVEGSASKAMGALKTSATVAAGALATLTGVIGKVGIQYNAMMEQSQIAWETILGSQEEAKKTLKELEVMGAKTPFEFEGLDKAAKLLNMAGFEGDNLFNTLTSVGDAVSAVGGGADELQGISMAIFQMASKGKISAEEMNQLAERGIPAWEMVAQQMGVSTQEVMKMSENGKLMAEDVLPKLTKEMGERFGGAMQKQSQTFNGMLSTLKDNLKMISGELSRGLFEKFKGILAGILPILDQFVTGLKENGLAGALKAVLPPSVYDSLQKIHEGFLLLKQGVMTFYEAFMSVWNNTGEIENILGKIGISPEKAEMARVFFQGIIDAFGIAKQGIIDTISVVKQVLLTAVEFWKGLYSGEGNLGQTFLNMIQTIKSIALPILSEAISFIKSILSELKIFWDENGQQIVQAMKNAMSAVAAIFEWLAPIVKFIILTLFEYVKGVISGALDMIMGLVKVFAGLFTGDFQKMWEGIKQIFSGAIEFVWNLINLMFVGRIIGGIKTMVTKGVEMFKGFWTTSGEIFKNLDTQIWNIITNFVSKIIGSLRGLYEQGTRIFSILKGFGESTFSALRNTLISLADNIWFGVKSKFLSLFESAKSIFGNLLGSAKTMFGRVKDAITSPIETAKNTVRNAIDAIKGFFTGMKVKIPMPHFNVSVSKMSVSGVDIPVPIPNLDVDWYDKGGIFTGPQIIGVGEKRPEFVGALDDLRAIVRDEFSKVNNNGNDSHGDIYLSVSTKDVTELNNIVDWAKHIKQTARQYGESLPKYMDVKV
jgi:tape measure domain-containing protein